MIWFTSDWHFGHDKDFAWGGPRNCESMADNTMKIVSRHNLMIKDEDDVYVLGDLMLGEYEYGINIIKQMKGKLHIILGNHDTDRRIELYKELPNVIEVTYAKLIRIGKQHYYLSHYPTFTANYDDKPYHNHIINLYGHTHQRDKFFTMGDPLYTEPNPFMYHVGVDSHDCYPVSIDEINKDIHDEINRQYKIKVQRAKEEKEYYENGLGYFECHPLGAEILD